MSAAIEFENISFAPANARSDNLRPILDGISFSVAAGTVTAILGRSGSGKTTLLRTVNRIVRPTSGDVLVQGRSIPDGELISLRRQIGYVIQETGLFPHFTVERNVGLVPELLGWKRDERARRTQELLSMVGLDPTRFSARYPHQLSGGQRQRVGLARALAADPGILLMDEPFGALDPLTRAEMQDLLRTLMSQLGKTVLLVTHDLDEALYLAGRIIFLNEGRVSADTPSGEFLHSSQPEIASYVRAFHRGEHAAGSTAKPGAGLP
jgi:osmoprotectant transport system ATP-binding protein